MSDKKFVANYGDDEIPSNDIVWTDDHEGAIWVTEDWVCFRLDKENYDAEMSPVEVRKFAAKLLEAANRLDGKGLTLL